MNFAFIASISSEPLQQVIILKMLAFEKIVQILERSSSYPKENPKSSSSIANPWMFSILNFKLVKNSKNRLGVDKRMYFFLASSCFLVSFKSKIWSKPYFDLSFEVKGERFQKTQVLFANLLGSGQNNENGLGGLRVDTSLYQAETTRRGFPH